MLGADGTLARLTTLALPGTAMGVTLAGDTLLVAAGNGGLHLVDIADPRAPVLLGTAPSQGWAWQALATGNAIWLADGSAGLRAFATDPYGLDPDANQARSLDLNTSIDPVRRAGLVADFGDTYASSLSGDRGVTWTAVTTGRRLAGLRPAGDDLRWRARLSPAADGTPPVCRSLTVSLDRDASHAVITGVTDVPDDDGGQVRVRWQASRHDAPGSTYLVTEYSIYRRIDAGKRWPEGAWEYLLSVPADREAEYAAVVPTLATARPRPRPGRRSSCARARPPSGSSSTRARTAASPWRICCRPRRRVCGSTTAAPTPRS